MLIAEYQRRKLRKTLEAVSADARIGQWFASLVEQGRAIPTDDQRRRLAKALDCDPDDLLKEVILDVNATAQTTP
jgi:transcriptional regulator with XRE-family HTH domain